MLLGYREEADPAESHNLQALSVTILQNLCSNTLGDQAKKTLMSPIAASAREFISSYFCHHRRNVSNFEGEATVCFPVRGRILGCCMIYIPSIWRLTKSGLPSLHDKRLHVRQYKAMQMRTVQDYKQHQRLGFSRSGPQTEQRFWYSNISSQQVAVQQTM